MEKVVVKKLEAYDKAELKRFIANALDSLGIRLKKDASVLVKPNFLLAKPSSSAIITNPVIIEAVLKVLIERGAKPFIYEIPSVSSVSHAAKACGVDKICKKLNVPIIEMGEFKFSENNNNRYLKRFSVPIEVKKANLIVNLAKLKTHSLMGLTMGVKNIFGLAKPEYRTQLHFQAGRNTEQFAHMIIDIFNLIKPGLTILDGIVGMEGNGPANGSIKKFNFIAASKNAFALDTLIVDFLNVEQSKIPIQKVAMKRNILGSKLRDIELIGDRPLLRNIKLPATYTRSRKRFLAETLNKSYPFLKKFFDAKPKVDVKKCESCFNCKKICPAKAISIKDKKPVIDYVKCIRCFCCHEVCPYDAISIHKTFLRKIIEKKINRNLGK